VGPRPIKTNVPAGEGAHWPILGAVRLALERPPGLLVDTVVVILIARQRTATELRRKASPVTHTADVSVAFLGSVSVDLRAVLAAHPVAHP
jgi:hypothetical protein